MSEDSKPLVAVRDIFDSSRGVLIKKGTVLVPTGDVAISKERRGQTVIPGFDARAAVATTTAVAGAKDDVSRSIGAPKAKPAKAEGEPRKGKAKAEAPVVAKADGIEVEQGGSPRGAAVGATVAPVNPLS